MALSHAIRHLYPNIKDSEFFIENVGQGDYIKSWTYSGAAKPNEEDLRALSDKFDEIIPLQRELNALVTEQLAKTDWLYIRNLRTGKKVPDAVANQNAEIYTRIDELQSEIATILA